jgi:hypothetical protein
VSNRSLQVGIRRVGDGDLEAKSIGSEELTHHNANKNETSIVF